jgi:alkanesulfonate monooxygenase SsuD/methylene tetrahydromethanopterin reductase-like flavin-dependent oxidoreductase (luciferase family)
MKYGLYLPNFGPFGDARTLADLADQAEQAGWDGFFIWDHVNRPPEYGPVVDPWVALSAAAMRTSRIKLGALVTPLPRRRPWVLARQTASLDHLSGGRLVFGTGIGSGRDNEWGDFGEAVEAKQRAAMLDEGLQVLAGLWSGQPFSFEGRHYRLRETQFLPPPVQRPRIPVWIGGNWPSPAPLRRAAMWDGAFILFQDEGEGLLAQVEEMVAQVNSYRQSDFPFDFVYRSNSPAGQSSGDLPAQMEKLGVTWWLEHLIPARWGGAFEGEWPLEEMREFVERGP